MNYPIGKRLAGLGALVGAALMATTAMATEITYWHVWGGPRMPMIDEMIAAFQKEHPGFTVNATLMDQADLSQKYLTAIASGSPPDVIIVHSARFFPTFAQKGVLVDLTPFAERDGMKMNDIFYESDVANYMWDGKSYGLPVSTDSGGWNFFYDLKQFEEAGLDPSKPPKTWQEVEAYAKALTVKDGDRFTRLGFNPVGADNYPFKEWLTLNKGKFISDDGRTILFNSPEGVQTMEWLVGFYDRVYGGFDKIVDLAGTITGSGRNEKGAWYNGQVAMHVDGSWHYAELQGNAPDKKAVATLMPYNGDNPAAKTQNVGGVSWGYSIPVGAKNVDAAWEFIKFATAGEGNRMFFEAQLRPGPVKAHNDNPALAEKNPYWKAFLENAALTVPIRNTPVQAEIDRVVVDMLEQALMHKKTPQQAIADGAAEMQAILNEHWAAN